MRSHRFPARLAITALILASLLCLQARDSFATPASAQESPAVCRDLDGNGVINVTDVMQVSAHLGSTNLLYDINGDGVVNAADINALAACWHQPLVRSRRINAPVFNAPTGFNQFAVFWFGRINQSDNYADVRVGVYPDRLMVHVASVDRLLHYDTSPAANDLTNWDSVTLYLDLDGNVGSAPSTRSFRFTRQLNWWEQNTAAWQAVDRGNGSGWAASSTAFTSETGWRGIAPNDGSDDSGWTATFYLPFSSFGLSGPPANGTVWGLGMALHDRDSEGGPPNPDKTWPPSMNTNQPSSWGQLSFGLPTYTPPPSTPGDTVTIRQGLNGAQVKDGAVGGHTICGDGQSFSSWGEMNYAGYTQFNVQNQYDIADWWCFSKYYVTFPLQAIPPGKTIISARLTLHEFGSAGGGQWGWPPDSLIQVSTVADDWNEATLTWNNAPLAFENVSQAWVQPGWSSTWPGFPFHWDLSRAVAQAYADGTPLRLAIYSADTDYHTGKYFSTSDIPDWGMTARPTLEVRWGTP